MFQTGATLTFQSATSATYTNPSGTKVVIDGVSFAFGASGPTAGVIKRVRLFNADQTVLQIDITGLNSALPAFHTAWFGTDGNAAGARLMTGNDVLNGSNGADSLFGVLGNDTINGGDGDDYIDPNQGTDTINGGAGLDMLSYSQYRSLNLPTRLNRATIQDSPAFETGERIEWRERRLFFRLAAG